MTEPLETLIRYRLERAQESLEDARLLAVAGKRQEAPDLCTPVYS